MINIISHPVAFITDETGITTVPNKMLKIMSLKGKKQVGALTSAEKGTRVTAEICFNALGNYIPPLPVFPRKKVNPLFGAVTPPETQVVCHPSGWMQSEIFAQKWFNHFLHHTKPTVDDPVLLIFDGHATHTKNIELIEMARENYVHLLVIPPHSSHRMQPLDVSFMVPLNTYYEQEVRKWLRNYPGKVITIYQLGALFGAAYRRSASTSTTINGFAKTGIYPLNPDIFPEHMFAPAETTDKPMPRVDPTPGTSDSNDDTEQTTDPESNNQITPDPLLAVHIPIALPTAVRQGSSAIVTPNLQTDPGPSCASQRTQINQPAKSLSQDQPISKQTSPDLNVTIAVPFRVGPPKSPPTTPGPSVSSSPAPSTSSVGLMDIIHPSQVSQSSYMSPKDIMGIPQADQDQPRRQGIKRGKTVVLTSSPYMK